MPRQLAASFQYARKLFQTPSASGASGAGGTFASSRALASKRSPASSGRTLASTSVKIGIPMTVIARPSPSASPVTNQVK